MCSEQIEQRNTPASAVVIGVECLEIGTQRPALKRVAAPPPNEPSGAKKRDLLIEQRPQDQLGLVQAAAAEILAAEQREGPSAH